MTGEAHCVLVVEDDPDIREVMILILEGAGYTVCGAEHGADALARLRGGLTPCLIVLDLTMPVMDGWTFCEETEKDPAFANVPIVVVSAVPRKATRDSSARAVARLTKPLDVAKLLVTVERHC
jgi:CheY-like chemotaxis protein